MASITAIGPGRANVRKMQFHGGHPGSKKLTKARMRNEPGKRLYKGCFGNGIPKSLKLVG